MNQPISGAIRIGDPAEAAGGGAVPRHVAIIMDGNGRWAKARGLPRTVGHREGAEALRRVVRASAEFGVAYLTVFGFSSENWKRPAAEVTDLMGLLRLYLRKEIAEIDRNGVRLRVIGDRGFIGGLEVGHFGCRAAFAFEWSLRRRAPAGRRGGGGGVNRGLYGGRLRDRAGIVQLDDPPLGWRALRAGQRDRGSDQGKPFHLNPPR